jgi:hypothetical protein
MNNFENVSKKKSFWNTLFNEFLGTILITSIIIYITVFILLGRTGIFNFMGSGNDIINGLVASAAFPIVLILAIGVIALAVNIVGLIPLIIHKIKAIYNYTYLPLTVDEIKDALDENIISSKEDYIKLILNSLRYGVTNKPSWFFSTHYIAFSEEELYSLCKAFEEVFDSPIVIDNDMLLYLNKYECSYSPFDKAKDKNAVSLITIRQEYENGKDATFALYTDGDKYKEILGTVDFPLYPL